MNCARGPATMLPCLKDIKAALPNTPLAALPVGYTTNEENPTMQVPQRACVCGVGASCHSACVMTWLLWAQSFSDWDKKYCELDHHTCTRVSLWSCVVCWLLLFPLVCLPHPPNAALPVRVCRVCHRCSRLGRAIPWCVLWRRPTPCPRHG